MWIEGETSVTSALVVFVHLGGNPAPSLIQNAVEAKRNLLGSHLVLVTNRPTSWKEFPGVIIHYDETFDRNPVIIELSRRFPEYDQIGNGYWIYTLERLFALSKVYEFYPQDMCLIHVESDVYSFIDEGILQALLDTYSKTAVPRYSSTEGVASIVFSPSGLSLLQSLVNLAEIISSNNAWITDMELLGEGLNSGALAELPTNPSHSSLIHISFFGEIREVIFDALALGQYFGGRDPVHSGGYAISGYLNPLIPFDPLQFNWERQSLGGHNYMLLNSSEKNLILGNLHMHSKRVFRSAFEMDNSWKQLISEANLEIPREKSDYVEDLIHTVHVSYLNRIRLLRRKGIRYAFNRIASRTLHKLD